LIEIDNSFFLNFSKAIAFVSTIVDILSFTLTFTLSFTLTFTLSFTLTFTLSFTLTLTLTGFSGFFWVTK